MDQPNQLTTAGDQKAQTNSKSPRILDAQQSWITNVEMKERLIQGGVELEIAHTYAATKQKNASRYGAVWG